MSERPYYSVGTDPLWLADQLDALAALCRLNAQRQAHRAEELAALLRSQTYIVHEEEGGDD